MLKKIGHSTLFLGALVLVVVLSHLTIQGMPAAAQGPTISISSLSAKKANPLSLITIVGAAFDPNSSVTVAFTARSAPKFQKLPLPKNFTLEVPVVSVTTTNVVVAAPFLTGKFLVQVVQRTNGTTIKSNGLKLTLKLSIRNSLRGAWDKQLSTVLRKRYQDWRLCNQT